MQNWQSISLALCVFGCLKEIRPSEPFVTDFLIKPWRNITYDEVNRLVYPIGTYSYLVQLIIIFLITDLLRYKPIIVLAGISGTIVWAMLAWTRSLQELQILELFYGTYMSTEVAYFTYIYAKVDRAYYNQVTSHTRAAILCGRFIAGSMGQLLSHYQLMNYLELNYITLSAQFCAGLWAIFALPSVPRSLYFHRDSILDVSKDNDDELAEENPHLETINLNKNNNTNIELDKNNKSSNSNHRENKTYSNALQLIWTHLRIAYTSVDVLIWCFWYVAGTCLYLQIISYIQILWTVVDDIPANNWNGAVEAMLAILGACTTLLAGRIDEKKNTKKHILSLLSILSIFCGIIILLTVSIHNRLICYIIYIIFHSAYSFTITITSAEIAKHLPEDSFALIFGINTFLAIALQSAITVIIITGSIWKLTIFEQFTVYGIAYIILGIIYLFITIYEIFKSQHCLSKHRQSNSKIEMADDIVL